MIPKFLRSLLKQYCRQDEFPVDNLPCQNFFIKDGYISRVDNHYFEDILSENEGEIVHQPDIYPFAAFIARRLGCSHIIDIGCGRASKLVKLHPEFQVYGIDYGSNIQFCRERYPFGKWIEWDLNSAKPLVLDPDVVRTSVIVCADVIEHLTNPLNVLRTIKSCLRDAPIAIVTTPERDLVRGPRDLGPPSNPSHVREWNLAELQNLIESLGISPLFRGLTVNNDRNLEKKTSIFILENSSDSVFTTAPEDFRVVAIMTAYNEEDIIVPTISHLISQGVEVYLIDNWSTDATRERAQALIGRGLIHIERFPAEGPPKYYEWERLLGRVEKVTQEIAADWFIHHDADEIRESPWPGTRLKDALYQVDCTGFNAIDHTVVAFPPVDDGFVPGTKLKDYFSFFEFGTRPGHFCQIKAWKNFGQPINLADAGGHEVKFEGRRIYPFNFLLRHYPIRSQSHGEKKVFLERIPRFNPEERAKGWHIQYDSLSCEQSFLKQPNEVRRFDEQNFYDYYLVERLSRFGIVRSE